MALLLLDYQHCRAGKNDRVALYARPNYNPDKILYIIKPCRIKKMKGNGGTNQEVFRILMNTMEILFSW